MSRIFIGLETEDGQKLIRANEIKKAAQCNSQKFGSDSAIIEMIDGDVHVCDMTIEMLINRLVEYGL